MLPPGQLAGPVPQAPREPHPLEALPGAAAGLGPLKTPSILPVPGTFPSPISVRIDAPEMCPVFAGRLIRGVKNGPSPEWLQRRLTAIGLRSINRLVDVTNLVAYDRCRPLHVYDAAKLVGSEIVVRAGQVAPAAGEAEQLIALDGRPLPINQLRGEAAQQQVDFSEYSLDVLSARVVASLLGSRQSFLGRRCLLTINWQCLRAGLALLRNPSVPICAVTNDQRSALSTPSLPPSVTPSLPLPATPSSYRKLA